MAKEFAPTCEVTGLPLPILPPGPRENGAFLYPHLPEDIPANNHHAWFEARKVRGMGLAGEALQNSRIQKVDWYVHKNFHEIFSRGPELPNGKDRKDKLFALGVKAVAGVIPIQAVDVGKERNVHEIVNLTPDQHLQIAQNTAIDQRKPIARFLADYAARQKITGVVDELVIEQFLDRRTDYVRKREIARTMLGGAVDLSLDNVGLYDEEKELKDQGLIAKPKPRTFYWNTKQTIRLNHLEYFSETVEENLVGTY